MFGSCGGGRNVEPGVIAQLIAQSIRDRISPMRERTYHTRCGDVCAGMNTPYRIKPPAERFPAPYNQTVARRSVIQVSGRAPHPEVLLQTPVLVGTQW